MAPLGLVCVGLGASLLGEAILLKGSGADTSIWFWVGTASLIVFNAGLCVFGDAIKHRVLFEWKTSENNG